MQEPDLRRIEEVSLNALQTQRQLFYDGWLLRVSPGRAKRGRSVNAHFGSTLPLHAKIAYCERLYRERELPTLFRITPFVVPADLDHTLEERGYAAYETTLVQVAGLDRPPDAVPIDAALRAVPATEFVDAIGDLRQLTPMQRQAHLERMAESPLRHRNILAVRGAHVLGCGQALLEDDIVGIYSMVTAEPARGQGIATAIVARLLAWAWERGATTSYLQVDASNASAIAVYRKYEFTTRYTYHYRMRPEELA